MSSIEQLFPIDGPYTADTVDQAVTDLRHLARYLAHATRSAQCTLEYATDVHAVLEIWQDTLVSLAQVGRQLANRLMELADDPALRVDAIGDPAEPTELVMTAESATGMAADAALGELAATPLAGRPYDLRHAALSTWLNAGVDAPRIAEWAGHSVAVLLRIYAKCLYGQDEAARKRIEAALGLAGRTEEDHQS